MMSVEYVDFSGVKFGKGCFQGWSEKQFIAHFETQKPFKDMQPAPRNKALKEAFRAVNDEKKKGG